MSLRIEVLSPHHKRSEFTCGVAALDRYFATQAGQDMRERVATCFVATDQDTGAIAGFFTIAATSILAGDLPPEQLRRLPRYPVLPAVLIGRLAVSATHLGKQIGAALLFDALLRSLNAEPAILTVVVDARDEQGTNFYGHHGFRSLPAQPLRLFLPLQTVAKLLRGQ